MPALPNKDLPAFRGDPPLQEYFRRDTTDLQEAIIANTRAVWLISYLHASFMYQL
jgi:hypothetical protein